MCLVIYVKKNSFEIIFQITNPHRELLQIEGNNGDRHLFLLTSLLQDDRKRLNYLSNLGTFTGKPIESEEFLNRMVETLVIIIKKA
ncbi:MAG: hypothetical protein IMZ41_00200 [Actinobacteria bacterium]|nr:hypothetical protein [Actinomycetota bacterium]